VIGFVRNVLSMGSTPMAKQVKRSRYRRYLAVPCLIYR
jgi:hypothetical protein